MPSILWQHKAGWVLRRGDRDLARLEYVEVHDQSWRKCRVVALDEHVTAPDLLRGGAARVIDPSISYKNCHFESVASDADFLPQLVDDGHLIIRDFRHTKGWLQRLWDTLACRVA